MVDAGSNLIVALDFDSPDAALDLAKRLDPATVRLKVGKQLFTLAGPDIVRSLQGLGFDIFLISSSTISRPQWPRRSRPPLSWVFGWSTSMRREDQG